MTNEEKLELIGRNTEEVLTRQELTRLISGGEPLKHYIGFEISGKVHLGTGIATMMKVRDFVDAGVQTTIFLADWHTWMNEKLGGDLNLIQEVAVGYFTEAMKASFICVGGDPAKLKFMLGTELYHNNNAYWQTVMEIAKHVSRSRIKRSISILGREEGDAGDFAKLIYPVMQVADIFALGTNIVHAGTDQRKAHVIARHVAPQLKFKPLRNKEGKTIKPVAIHHHLLLGLGKPPVWPVPKGKKRDVFESMKMSKSKPSSAIFIHDNPDEIKQKITDAFCPPKEVDFNPIMDWVKHLVFAPHPTPYTLHPDAFRIPRLEKYGGIVSFSSYEELEKAYRAGELHPEDLKLGMAEWLIEFLGPARKYFGSGTPKKCLDRLNQLLSE